MRKILSALDGPSAPSPVHVRFGAADITTADLNGVMKFVLDRADLSVSREVLVACGYEPEVTAVLESVLNEGMTFVDIGANIGIHTVLGLAALLEPLERALRGRALTPRSAG